MSDAHGEQGMTSVHDSDEPAANSHTPPGWPIEVVELKLTPRMMPARYVKPYVKRGKSDAADAEAICGAVTRPTMRFVAIKSRNSRAW